ncbi:MAG TPA: glycine cleavage system aminomethyltransferase GcvT, partial [bacterium]|nr:glycine cleavage system aminomethyltransferase GcvT [bacterium]
MGLRTALYEDHVKLGANIVDFAGWELPVQYTKVIEEHEATRERAGLFDIGHMGEFEITGKDAFEYLQYIFTRELKDLTPGTAMYSTMLFPNGGTIDDLFVYRLEPEKFMVVVNAANIKKDWDWIAGHIGERAVQMKDVSDSTSKIDVQGPLSAKIMGKLTNSELPARFGFTHGEVAGIKT